MATKKENKDLVSTEGLSVEEMPEWMLQYQKDNSGNEQVTKDDLVIPRLCLIQAISPEIDKKDPAYIEGAEVGMMFNSLTRELMDEIKVISLLFNKPYLLWRDRKKGGGFGGQFSTMEEAEEAVSAQEHPEEWGIADTPTNLCLALPETGKPYEIAIPMPKSKAKVARNWNSMARLVGGPRFCRIYKITSVDDKNTAGEKFKNFRVDFAGFPSEELFNSAKDIYSMVSSGEKSYKTDYSDEENNPPVDSEKPAF